MEVRKGYEDHFYSGILNGKLVQGKLSDLDDSTLDAIAKSDSDQNMVMPSVKQASPASEPAPESTPVKPEPPKK
jgi:hypothetical protein